MTRTSIAAKAFILFIVAMGTLVLATGLWQWETKDPTRYLFYFLLALLASGLRMSLPAVPGTVSVSTFFILVGIVQLSLPETLLMGCAATLVTCLADSRLRKTPAVFLFHVCNVAIAIAVGEAVYRSAWLRAHQVSPLMPMALAAFAVFAMNTFPAAVLVAVPDRKKLGAVWHECSFYTLPDYLAGAALAAAFIVSTNLVGWRASLPALPLAYFIYRASHQYIDRLKSQKRNAQEMAALHLRTIEALALAIEAKYQTASDHLRRLQIYSEEIGIEMGLEQDELAALRAAALLHDIGVLGIPEHILSKAGRLTREEFDKVKIHPLVGAQILEQMRFPYPVAAIVRFHHEKWNGGGYPDGLKGKEIPLGARILAVTDCFAALTADRPYRRALPVEQSLAYILSESGTSYDPRVVEILARRHGELERMVQASLSRDACAGPRQQEPAPSREAEDRSLASPVGAGFVGSITAARQEAQVLFELTHDLGSSLSLNATLSVFAARLKRVVPFDCLAIYLRRDGRLLPEYVNGENFSLFLSLEIPDGQGLSGWVAHNGKPLLNGNPSLEFAYLRDPRKSTSLRSALSIPLPGTEGSLGAVTLYRTEKEGFTKDHLRVLLAIRSKLALVIENALKYQRAADNASTDFLTGLPNARSLFLHLDGELARCRRLGGNLTVLVCDLDGFKQVNDRYGHLEGNRLLCAVSRAFQENCREYDYVARMGGDEFVLVLPGLKEESVRAKTVALTQTAEAAGAQISPEVPVSLSIGQASYPEEGQDAEQLLAKADQEMYKSKLRRRSRAGTVSPQGYDFDWHNACVQ